jgi:hypothetical protein
MDIRRIPGFAFKLQNKKKTINMNTYIHTIYIHTYHSRFITVGVAEASQISLRDVHVLHKLFSYE